ncbi:hypothetical protein PInf_019803 [Phytophthora infestans]|nr:hypothetical protein PInf_019803 [Phytophthora infestans]
MNSLGLEYGSSSDEADERARPVSPPQTQVVAVDAPSVKVSVVEPTAKANDAPAKPIEEPVESNKAVDSAAITGPDMSMDDEDLEAMLLRAGIPPATAPLADDNETQQRIEKFLRVQRERGQDFQTTLQDKKEVRNPYILEKVVEYFGIDELQSNFPPDVFTPMAYHCTSLLMCWLWNRRSAQTLERNANSSSNGAAPILARFILYLPTHSASHDKFATG